MLSILCHSTKSGRLATITLLAAICLSCQEAATSWESHWERGNLYFQQRDFVKAEAEIKVALKLAETREAQYPNVTRSIVGLGMLYDAQRRFEEAQRHFERALHLIENTRGPRHPDLVMPLNYLGALHAIQHQFDRALPYFERAFSIQERSSGPAHPLIREHIKYLAALHVTRAQYLEAEAFLTRVLDLTKPSSEKMSREAAEYFDNYTRLHTAQEEYNKAKPYLEEFDRLDDGQIPKNLQEMSTSLARLTNVLATHDKFEKAEGLLRRALEKTQKTQDLKGIPLEHRLLDLADVYWAWGKLDAAIPLLERSLSMITENSGSKDGSKLRPSSSMGLLLQTNNQLAEAAASYRHVLGTGKSNGGGDPQILMETQQTYLTVLRRANQAALQNVPTE